MHLQLQPLTAPLQFTLHGTEFLRELKKITAVFKTTAEFYVHGEEETLTLVVMDSSKSLALQVAATQVQGHGTFKLAKELLVGILNRRTEIAFTATATELRFQAVAGKYQGAVSVESVSPQLLDQYTAVFAVEVTAISVPERVLTGLEHALKYANLKDAYGEAEVELVRYLTVDTHHLQMVTYDQFHSAIITVPLTKPLKKSFTLAVYHSYLQHLHTLATGERIYLSISDKYFYVQSTYFFLSLPPLQYDPVEFANAVAMLTALREQEAACTFTLDIEKFNPLLKNLTAVYETGSALKWEVGDQLTLEVSTSYGTIQDSLPITPVHPPQAFKVSIPPLRDVLGCLAPQEATLTLLPHKAYCVQQQVEHLELFYACSVLQNPPVSA